MESDNGFVQIGRLFWEARAPREEGAKRSYAYDEHCARLGAMHPGYRTPLPAQASRVLLNLLGQSSTPEERQVADDMNWDTSGLHEWLGASFETEKQGCRTVLKIYDQVTNLRLADDGRQYDLTGERPKASRTFDLGGLDLDANYFAAYLPTDLVNGMWGRLYQQFPEAIKSGRVEAKLYLPEPGRVWPAALLYAPDRVSIGVTSRAASRAVRFV